jgi:maltose alpha-D-glucosyltransferase/alpha-amylase
VAQQFFWHRFFSHQPDLNFDNPDVLEAVKNVMRFWLRMGVDGLRLDAIPYLIERDNTNCENLPETHAVLKELRHTLDAEFPNRIFLAEANQWPTDVRAYFGESDECHMAFHFPVMPRMYMALRKEDRTPLVDIMRQTPEIPADCQWAIFLRNHDELTLEMVTSDERDYMYREYARDPRMRVNVGIRRRLAPLMENGRRQMELMNALLMSLPGTPIIYYGDEIGMGDNVYLGDRNGVRTPMQWSVDRNAGFSDADTAALYAPVIADPPYSYHTVNVAAQDRTPTSLLRWMRRLVGVRKRSRAFGRGTFEALDPHNRRVLVFLRRYLDDVILCVNNLSRFAQFVELDLTEFTGRVPVEMWGDVAFPPIGELPYLLTLGPHNFLWFRLVPPDQQPARP